MPRQGVPYPSREICSLKCQIDALNAKINELMKSINGVQGDGQGDLSLVSGDPAIVINNDQAQHEIEIALDQSALPSALVSSVNGQTGAVALEADDIPSDGNSDVQADIDALKALGVNLQGAINNEVTARGNADAALQTNINAVAASIPDMSVTPDPYKGVERDAQGRAFAQDPASGATDKTLVTANWVSQTGAGRPNNLIHDGGNENIGGTKTATYLFRSSTLPLESIPYKYTNNNGWKLAYSWDASNVQRGITFLVHSRNDGRAVIFTAIGGTPNGQIHNNTSWTGKDNSFRLAYNITNARIELYTMGIRDNLIILSSGISNNEGNLSIYVGDQTEYPEPVVGDTYAWVVGVTS